MTSRNDDWLSVSVALNRLDVVTAVAAEDIIGAGRIPVFALRSDMPGRTNPEPVEALLDEGGAGQSRGERYHCGLRGRAGHPINPRGALQHAERECGGLGVRGAASTVRFRSARVNWPQLVEALEAQAMPSE
jgi:hypothetical protein